jgi:hypothetical protein
MLYVREDDPALSSLLAGVFGGAEVNKLTLSTIVVEPEKKLLYSDINIITTKRTPRTTTKGFIFVYYIKY